MNTSKIILALPNKGRLQKPALKLLEQADIEVTTTDREYLAETSEPQLQLIFARASDIPVYVHFGATDLGITGHDLILERSSDVYELMNLAFGECKLVLAVPNNSEILSLEDLPNGAKVATEFPNITDMYFEKKGKKVEIITVHGVTEITPTIGLADAIVDLVSTGITLKSNNLKPIETILTSTARLVCNKISLRTKGKIINSIVKRLKTKSRAN
jgi:ATP phosphoribosyltransferase